MENHISPSPVFDPSVVNRDDGKHQINAAHKRRLMEELAAALWRSGEKQWDADRLEDWLDDFLYANPKLADGYRNKDRDVLKGDLRTATFVLRPDGEAKHNRFAHTSLQEYFLACYLVRTLKDEATASAAWDMPIVSVETLDFMGQLLALDPQVKKALTTMEKLMGEKVLRAACLGFAYWMQAIQKGYPEPAPGHVCLAGIDSGDLIATGSPIIKGHGPSRPLNLRGATIDQADLDCIEVRWVDFSGAVLTGSRLQASTLEGIQFDHALLRNIDLTCSVARRVSLTGADLTGASFERCRWMVEGQDSATFPENWQRHFVGKPIFPTDPGSRLPDLAATEQEARQTSHGNPESFELMSSSTISVYACAWSPNGRCLLCGSDDGTIQIWDASTGLILLTCHGHVGPIWACAWSPDGYKVLTGSNDTTLKVWDAITGRCLLTCQGHRLSVRSCAWSPDGRYLLSSSADGTLKVWTAGTGQCLRTFFGHTHLVMACAWSPDSRRLLSGSYDKTMKVWDANTGQCLLTCLGHNDLVHACAWSPDGLSLLSASNDETLKVWNTSTGQCLLTCYGFTDSELACAWSPDGRYLLSGTRDGSLKVWDAGTGEWLRRYEGHTDAVLSCAWSPDSRHLLSGSKDGTLKLWDAQTGECLRTHVHLPNNEWAVIEGHDKRPLAVSRGAWPYLAWQVRDTPDGEPYLLPSEAFGPLPEVD